MGSIANLFGFQMSKRNSQILNLWDRLICSFNLLLFQVTFLFFVVAIDVAVHTHTLTVVQPVVMLARCGIASLFSAEHVVAVIAHTLGIVLCCLMWAISNSLPSSRPLLILDLWVFLQCLPFLYNWFSYALRALAVWKITHFGWLR